MKCSGQRTSKRQHADWCRHSNCIIILYIYNTNRASHHAVLPLPVSSPLPQHNSNYQPPAAPQVIPEGGSASNCCLSEENQSQQPSQTQPQPQGATQEPGGYMLTPNAPVLYGAAYSPFEKPPPYACWATRPTSGGVVEKFHLNLVGLNVARYIA